MSVDPVAALARRSGEARRHALEAHYQRFNHPQFRRGDPVAFVWRFSQAEDRAAAAWAAAALSFGRVASIQAALTELDRRWEGRPHAFCDQASPAEMRRALRGFVYRWIRPEHLVGLLHGWRILDPARTLPERLTGPDLRAALIPVLRDLRAGAAEDPGYLLPDPAGPGACKRLAMWMRWMVRRDAIDPGLWADSLSPAGLWVPLDTHMFRIARRLRLTRRKTPDGEASRRITNAFRRIRPDDPLRYDFAITRLGMRVDV